MSDGTRGLIDSDLLKKLGVDRLDFERLTLQGFTSL